MPLYDYAPKSGKCARCGGRFEVVQKIAEPRLKRCPACRKPVERLVSAVSVQTKFSTSNSKISDLGMTKYVKTSDGSYERQAGRGGPKMIRKPDGD
jgi:putative FmdB family regulatory protein